MTLHIEDLKFQAIIGILDFERITPQNVIVNILITYEYKISNKNRQYNKKLDNSPSPFLTQ